MRTDIGDRNLKFKEEASTALNRCLRLWYLVQMRSAVTSLCQGLGRQRNNAPGWSPWHLQLPALICVGMLCAGWEGSGRSLQGSLQTA